MGRLFARRRDSRRVVIWLVEDGEPRPSPLMVSSCQSSKVSRRRDAKMSPTVLVSPGSLEGSAGVYRMSLEFSVMGLAVALPV
jgi:hypothetical protein